MGLSGDSLRIRHFFFNMVLGIYGRRGPSGLKEPYQMTATKRCQASILGEWHVSASGGCCSQRET